MKKETVLKTVLDCYFAFVHFNPKLNRFILLQTVILIFSRCLVALFSLALSYFINKQTHITILETFTVSVITFYCFNRMLEWFVSAIHGRLHTQFILPCALNFVDQIIYMMLRNYTYLKLKQNPVELANLLNKKSDARGFLGFLFHHISTPIFELIVCAILLVKLGFGWLGLVLIPVSLVYLLISMQLMPKIKQKIMQVLSIAARASGVFSSSLENSNLATTFGTVENLVAHLKNVTEEESLNFKNSALLNDFMATLLNLPLAVFACLFFYFGAQQVQSGTTTYGAFAVLISIVMNSFTQLKNLSFAFDGLSNSLTALTLHLDIFNRCKNQTATVVTSLNHTSFSCLELKNLQVSHDEKTLFNINLQLKRGEKIYIVGNSGAGKTSLVRSLLGYKDYFGDILINDQPINLAQHPFAWMPQECQAIEGTVRFNLSLGNQHATDDDMNLALQQVHLYEKIQAIGGLDADLIYKGNNLSGGENQRLSLARCLLSHNPIMILDEPSSALDMNLEQEIFSHIQQSNRSALIIVHRLKAIPKDATVLFMQSNQIYCLDSLNNLVSNNQEFKKLYYSNDSI